MDTLPAAIEHLYATFANYRAGAIAGCPCCVMPEDIARLRAKRLRELGKDALAKYSFQALSTWGTLTDWKHFLPRVLELTAARDLGTDVQVVYEKMVYEGPWSDAEIEAIARFTSAWFEHLATHREATRYWQSPSDVLEAAGLANLDVTAMLTRTFPEGADDPVRASTLAELVRQRGGSLVNGDGAWTWWRPGAGADSRCVDTWLLRGTALRILARAVEAHLDHPDAGAWAEAHDILDALSPPR